MAKGKKGGHSSHKNKGAGSKHGSGPIPKMHPGTQPRGPHHGSHKHMPMKG